MSNGEQTQTQAAATHSMLVDAVLARDCFLCLAPSGGALLCPACDAALPRLHGAGCPVCALPMPTAGTCGACLRHPPHFDASHAAFRYEFPLDRLIVALKYGHRLACADFLAQALREALPPAQFDLVLPVPLSAKRLAERGFNQAVEIARPLARRLGIPLDTRHVLRTIDTLPQAGLPWKERAKNIRHAFECRANLGGKAILVVDDVMTTGATLNELAGTLKAAGARRVENLVVARAVRHAAP